MLLSWEQNHSQIVHSPNKRCTNDFFLDHNSLKVRHFKAYIRAGEFSWPDMRLYGGFESSTGENPGGPLPNELYIKSTVIRHLCDAHHRRATVCSCTLTMLVLSTSLFIMMLNDVKRLLTDSMKSDSPLFSYSLWKDTHTHHLSRMI